MKYASRLTKTELFNFLSIVMNKEFSHFYSKPEKNTDFSKYFYIINKDDKEITIASNFNCGLCCYNVFTLTDFTFSSLYPTCQVGYENEWRKFLQKRFPSYENDLKHYLAKQSEK